MNSSKFVLTLDFEKIWGVSDVISLESFSKSALKVDSIISSLMKLADDYNVTLTFNTVGFLFAYDFDDLNKYKPDCLPKYFDSNLSNYHHSKSFESLDISKGIFFSSETLKRIEESNHELGTHTHSHYYCLEDGQSPEDFRKDLILAKKIAVDKTKTNLTSIVFPRNQYNKDYLRICNEEGIKVYRGTENHFIYKSRKGRDQSMVIRMLRLLDAYVNLTGHHTSKAIRVKDQPINVPSSRFLRPYNHTFRLLEPLKMKRISKSMRHAAKQNAVFHLWFHPHNFSMNSEQNFQQLEMIFKTYKTLNKSYGMQSVALSSFSA